MVLSDAKDILGKVCLKFVKDAAQIPGDLLDEKDEPEGD